MLSVVQRGTAVVPAAALELHGVRSGALVTGLREMTPAARSGLQTGDLVTEVAGRPVTDARSFARAVRAALPRSPSFTVTFRREPGEESQTRLGGRRS